MFGGQDLPEERNNDIASIGRGVIRVRREFSSSKDCRKQVGRLWKMVDS